jgi:hypothetical protein
MLRDRGKIKWASMMLPEHVKFLRDWAKEDAFEASKEIDEQYLEIMNERILEAVELGKKVMITCYRNHKYETVIGTIHHWNEINQQLNMVDQCEEVQQISLASIVDVQNTEE